MNADAGQNPAVHFEAGRHLDIGPGKIGQFLFPIGFRESEEERAELPCTIQGFAGKFIRVIGGERCPAFHGLKGG